MPNNIPTKLTVVTQFETTEQTFPSKIAARRWIWKEFGVHLTKEHMNQDVVLHNDIVKISKEELPRESE